jgi:hypothetical protein
MRFASKMVFVALQIFHTVLPARLADLGTEGRGARPAQEQRTSKDTRSS